MLDTRDMQGILRRVELWHRLMATAQVQGLVLVQAQACLTMLAHPLERMQGTMTLQAQLVDRGARRDSLAQDGKIEGK